MNTRPTGKSAVAELTFDSWEDFKARFNSVLFGAEPFRRGRYLFRGHANADWRLETTFDRMFAELKGNRFKIAREMVAEFKRELEGLDVPAELRAHENAVLAFGQHYGLPTRLLDWTESPYVAAFFAFNSSLLWGITEDKHVALWVLDPQDPIWQPENGVEIVDVPIIANKRIRNQSGKFTLLKTPSTTLEQFVSDNQVDGTPLRKFLVPASDAPRAIADLDAMGIHHGTVYPDYEGAAQMVLLRAVMKLKTALASNSSMPRPA